MPIAPASTSSYPLRSGNTVRPLVDGIPAFRAILAAVDAATQSVWITVAFLDEGFAFPDAHGTFFHALQGAAARGVDVRVLFWSEPEIEKLLQGSSHFPAGLVNSQVLAAHAPGVLARWDRLRGYCHHQKSWIVDAGTDAEIAFVGGINLDHDSIVSPGHPHGEGRNGGSIHDVYVALRGPSATDVHHNFVQRWNEASERDQPFGAFPTLAHAGDLEFPRRVSREAGDLSVQVARTVRSGVYRTDVASPGASPFRIANGELSILEQYLAAVDAAERTIYLENQILLCPFLVPRLHAALERGVDVVAVVPGKALPEIARARRLPQAAPLFAMIDDLARHDNFLMAALATVRDDGTETDIYVHAKVAIVDDEWLTIGSANAMIRSFCDDTEMNVTAWSRDVATGLRRELFVEHLGEGADGEGGEGAAGGPAGEAPAGEGTARSAGDFRDEPRGEPREDPRLDDDRRAVRLLRDRALDNSQRRREGRPMRGSIFAIDPRQWAVPED